MNLVIDIGNSRTKIGVFDGKDLVLSKAFDKMDADEPENLVLEYGIKHVMISSVGALSGDLTFPAVSGMVIRLGAKTPLPVQSRYETPETLGNDRIAGVTGAFALYPGHTNLVIDMGTCITYDVIDNNGIYLGGNIAPGEGLRYKAMHAFTARLPLVSRAPVQHLLGRSTSEALVNGGQLGVVMEVQGYLAQLHALYDDLQVILTGGDAAYFAEKFKSRIFVHPDLVLTGLNEILEFNVAGRN